MLEGAQPYSGGDGVLLPILEDLDNYDKHRYPPVMTVGGLVPSFNIGVLHARSFSGPHLGPVKPDTEIMRFVPVEDAPMQMDFPTAYHVAFAEGKPGQGQPILPLLSATRDFIRSRIAEPLDAYL